MALPNDVEEILSDDYEEGEILEDDDLYEDVSSLEDYIWNDRNSSAENRDIGVVEDNHTWKKTRRKKEHRCKNDSVCRRERKGKHCFARIRKCNKTAISDKCKVAEPVQKVETEKYPNKKEEPVAAIKRTSERPISSIPSSRLRVDHGKPYRQEYKDFHEKERPCKRHWSSNENSSRNKSSRYSEQSSSRTTKRDPKSKYSSLNSVLGPYRNKTDSKVDATKTSLLKRLVGSGSSGVKSLKDNETVVKSNEQTEKPIETAELVPSNNQPVPESNPSDICDLTVDDAGVESQTVTSDITTANDNLPVPPKEVEAPSEPKKKGIGLVWKRSMKDDKDELHLRVEALKSAWIKKFSERKKKGLVSHKKSNNVDDSLAEFILETESDEEDDKPVETKKDALPKFTVTDLSGDILQPKDMVIVALNDTSQDKPIISEPALLIQSSVDSSVFIPSTPIYVPAVRNGEKLPQIKPLIKPLVEPNLPKPIDKNSSLAPCNNQKNQMRSNKTPRKKSREKSALSRSAQKSNKKKERRLKKKSKREKLPVKPFPVSKEIDEERILRENALRSLKHKSKTVNMSSMVEKEDKKTICSMGEKIDLSSPITQMISLSALPPEMVSSEKEINNKNLLSVCDSIGSDTIKGDVFEEDIDEDILRAQLLSSLTKQVTKTVNDDMIDQSSQNPPIKKILPKKQRLKAAVKRVWKNQSTLSKVKVIGNEMKARSVLKPYGKENIKENKYMKENRVTGQVNGPLSQAGTVPIPQVAKMIINVDDSDTSSETDSENVAPENKTGEASMVSADIEANIDLFLQEAKQKSLFNRLSNAVKTNLIAKPSVPDNDHPESLEALKHLPAWQQEEYKRLKKQIAEKEKVLQEVSRAKWNELEELNRANSIQSEDVSQGKKVDLELVSVDVENKTPIIVEGCLPISSASSLSPLPDSSLISINSISEMPANSWSPLQKQPSLVNSDLVPDISTSSLPKSTNISSSTVFKTCAISIDTDTVSKSSAIGTSPLRKSALSPAPKSPGISTFIEINKSSLINIDAVPKSSAINTISLPKSTGISTAPINRPSIVNMVPIPKSTVINTSTVPNSSKINMSPLPKSSVLKLNPLSKSTNSVGKEGSRENSPVLTPALTSHPNLSSDENSSLDKKSFPNIASCTVMEDINVMNDIVSEFEKTSSDYSDLKRKINRLKRSLKQTELDAKVKEKKLLEAKDDIKKKDRMICSRIDSLTLTQNPSVTSKPVSRDMELIKLKYKEVSLRAQFQFHNFSTLTSKAGGKVTVLRKDQGLPRVGVAKGAMSFPTAISKKSNLSEPPVSAKTKDPTEPPTKRSFSGKEREGGDWDPNTPVCHFDLNGICRDQECKFQHFKTV